MPLYCGSAPVSSPLALANSLTAWTSLVVRIGHGGANVRSVAADVEVVAIGEVIVASGIHVALDSGSAAGKDHHDVLAELGEVALVAGAEAFAEADEEQKRTDSPGDAEHGEKGTQLVRPKGAENLREDVDD